MRLRLFQHTLFIQSFRHFFRFRIPKGIPFTRSTDSSSGSAVYYLSALPALLSWYPADAAMAFLTIPGPELQTSLLYLLTRDSPGLLSALPGLALLLFLAAYSRHSRNGHSLRKPAGEPDKTAQRLQEVLNVSLSGIVMFRAIRNSRHEIKDFELVLINPAAERMSGFTQADTGKRMSEMVLSEPARALFETYVSVAETGKSVEFEFYSEKLTRWFQVSVVQSAEGVVITFSDITARKTAEEANKRAETLLDDSQELGHVGSFDWDIRTNHITWSAEHYRIFGYSPGTDINYQKAEERFHPDDRARINEAIARALRNAEPFNCEFRVVQPDNSERYVWSKARTYFDENGRPYRMLGSVVDITEIKSVQKTLYDKNQELTQALEELQSTEEQLLVLNNDLEQRVMRRTAELTASEEELRQMLDKTVELNEKLADNEQFLSSIIDQSPVCTWIADIHGTMIRINEAGLRLLNIREAGQVVGKYTILEDEVLKEQPFFPDIRSVFTEGRMARFEIYYDLRRVTHVQVPEARPVYMVCTIFPVKNSEGKVTHAVVKNEDITERKVAEEALIASEIRYRFMAESIPAIIWTADASGDIDYYNSQWTNYTGIPPENALGRNLGQSIHPDDLEATTGRWNHSLQTGEPFRVEHRLRRADGRYYWFRTRALPYHDTTGRVAKWFGTTSDIDDEKRSAERLAESKKQFEFLADFMPQLVWRTEPNGDHDYFNRRWYEYTGLSYEDTKNKGWSLVLHPDDYKRTVAVWNHSLETGEPYEIEYRFRKADGSYRWFLGRALPMRDQTGTIVKWFGTCTDIQEQKNTIEKLSAYQLEISKTNEELTRINVDLDNFIYTASHDLRAPIANLEGISHQLVKRLKGKLNESEETLLNMSIASIGKLKKTIQDLTEITKAQKEINSPTEPVSLRQVLEDVEMDLQRMIDQAEAEISPDLQADCLRYSRKNIRSIMYNLLTNAIKYRSPDRPLHISVRTRTEQDDVVLEVTDNGLGIRQDQQHKLFTMFKRLHTHVEDTGIGLYIIKRIIENNKGTIQVDSREGEGTTFRIRFIGASCGNREQ
jgi:PAS domain S-box-containing protein